MGPVVVAQEQHRLADADLAPLVVVLLPGEDGLAGEKIGVDVLLTARRPARRAGARRRRLTIAGNRRSSTRGAAVRRPAGRRSRGWGARAPSPSAASARWVKNGPRKSRARRSRCVVERDEREHDARAVGGAGEELGAPAERDRSAVGQPERKRGTNASRRGDARARRPARGRAGAASETAGRLQDAVAPAAKQRQVPLAHRPPEQAVGERPAEPLDLRGAIVGLGRARVVVAASGAGQQLGASTAAQKRDGLRSAPRRAARARAAPPRPRPSASPVVADRQQHARGGLQRALEEAAQIDQRQPAARARRACRPWLAGGATQSSWPRNGGPDVRHGSAAAQLAQRRELPHAAPGPAQRRAERRRPPLARGRRDDRARGRILVARQRRPPRRTRGRLPFGAPRLGQLQQRVDDRRPARAARRSRGRAPRTTASIRSRAASSVSRNMCWSCSRGVTSPGCRALARRSSARTASGAGKTRSSRPATKIIRNGSARIGTNDATVTPSGARCRRGVAPRRALTSSAATRKLTGSAGGMNAATSAIAAERVAQGRLVAGLGEDRLGDRPPQQRRVHLERRRGAAGGLGEGDQLLAR